VLPQWDIVSKWDQLAFHLLGRQFFYSNTPDKVRSCIEVFKDWIAGKGRPATWMVLIETLKTMNLHSACNRIIGMLKGKCMILHICMYIYSMHTKHDVVVQ